MCLGLKRYFTWSMSKSRRSGTRGFSSESKKNLRWNATRNCFFEKDSQSSKRGFWRWYAVQQHQTSPWELQPGAEGGVVNRVQLDVQAAIPERQAPPPTVGEQLPRRVYIRRSVELARYRNTDRCVGCQRARLGLKPADHDEECRARVVRHMTADDNLNQRVRIAQDRIVETTPPEARTGERDPVPEPARSRVTFAERIEEQTRGYCCYKFTEFQQQFEQFKQEFQFGFQQQSNRHCTIDAG